MTDNELYKKCKEYGRNAKLWKQKFAGLLPEVENRQLHRMKGFLSIHEFAAKLGGMSFSSVDRVLQISKKLADKPNLKEELTTGAIHWSKIEKVVYVATPETEKEWVEKVRNMTRPALEIAVREARQPEKSPPGGMEENKEIFRQMSISLSPKVEKQLRILKWRVEKDEKRSLTWDEALELFFAKKPSQKEVVTLNICPECIKKENQENPQKSRHIPVAVKRIITAKYGGSCSFRGCKKPADFLHHTRRFALNSSHDPDYIVPLCKAHERFVHCGLVEDENIPPNKWQSRNMPDTFHPKFHIDQKVKKHVSTT